MGTIKTMTKDGKPLKHPQFFDADGKRLSTVTTIIKSISGGQEGLLHWANTMGLDGVTLEDARNQPADVGSYAHAAIEAIIKNERFDIDELKLEPDQKTLVNGAVAEWRRWSEQSLLKIIACERALIHDGLRYGGVIDCVAYCGDRLSVLDWKTGASVYPEALIQVVAYGNLWWAAEHQEIAEYHVIRLGKTDGSFHHHSWSASAPAVAIAQELWQLALEVHPRAERLRKMMT